MRWACLLVIALGCSRQVHPDDDPRVSPMERAVAVGLIALSTGVATTASQCPTTSADECHDLSWRAGSVVLGVTLATAAQAWLQAQEDEQEAAVKRKRSAAAALSRQTAGAARAAWLVPLPSGRPARSRGFFRGRKSRQASKTACTKWPQPTARTAFLKPFL